jgi:molybdopterin-guanine dinucleotide biosynthesis protein B
MIPILSIVGKSGSGKTTLLEALIPLFRERGYRVGTIKHASHEFPLDQEGKDSWRHAQAGAEIAVVSTPKGVGVFQSLSAERGLAELVESHLSEMDLVLAEGYKGERVAKIEVHRSALGEGLLSSKEEGLLAVASDVPIPAEVPVFSLNDPQTLADFLEDRLLRNQQREKVQLLVDGHRLPLNPFVHDLFHSLLLGMVAPLKGIGRFRRLTLRLDASEEGKAIEP